jgi:hypothetical protein
MAAARKNFFISYRRNVDADRNLAKLIYDGLTREKHDVFIDVDISPGKDWGKEIVRRIEHWCHYFVVLLSENSIQSEMVQEEVHRAYQHLKSTNTPVILPIRLKYTGSLGYQLDAYLSSIQYMRCDGPEDSDRILNVLSRIAREEAVSEIHTADLGENGKLAAQMHAPRPLPAADPRIIKAAVEDPRIVKPPGGSISPNDPFYIERTSDALVRSRAAIRGDTLTIKAPRQMGKSSLLVRYLMACRDGGKQQCLVDFQQFTNDDLKDYMTFLGRLYASMQRYLDLEPTDDIVFKSQQQFSNYIEDYILKAISAPVTIAFDEVDRILGYPYQHDFFAMLRSWHNKRSDTRTKWYKADLALVIATEPYLLITSSFQSPFNVSDTIELAPFTRTDVDILDVRYGSELSPANLDKLFALMAGHPYLTRLALYRVVITRTVSLDTLLDTAAHSRGPFGDHLRSRLLLLQQKPELLNAMRKLAAKGIQPDEEASYLLQKTGLVSEAEGILVPANDLYRQYFRSQQ